MNKIFSFAKIFILIFYFGFSNIVFAATSNITSLVFTNDVQSAAISTLSSEIIVQTQNSSGGAEKVDETNDVAFTSTSATGEFLNSSGNPVSTTMSKNTSSRTFYYRDSTEGIYTLTVSIKGRDSGKTFSATQKINIGNTNNSESNTQTSSNVDSSSSSLSNNSVSGISSHSSDVDITSLDEEVKLKVDAGRKRLSIVNSPINFKANFEQTGISREPFFEWSFGDGYHEYGQGVFHSYTFPGTYNVVLNVSGGNTEAVSRTQAVIIDPSLEISTGFYNGKKFIEIKNNSREEVNLQGFRIFGAGNDFVFPTDTIVTSNSSIKIPISTNISGQIELYFPNKEIVSRIAINSDEENLKQIQEIEDKLSALRSEIISSNTAIDIKEDKPVPVAFSSSTEISELKNTSTTEELKEKEGEIMIESISRRDKKDFVESLLATPKRLFEFIIKR